jgi:PAS domain S-box-containing protein
LAPDAANGRNAELGLDQLAQLASFVVAADEQLKVTWASKQVLARAEDALGLEVSDIIELIDPSEAISPSSIARTIGAPRRMLLKRGGCSTLLSGQWILSSAGFILLARPDLAGPEDLDTFSFDDFAGDDLTIELLTTREEHAVMLQEARSASQALIKARLHLEGIFTTLAEGVMVIDPDGQITRANPAAERMFGLTHSWTERRDYISSTWEFLRPDGTPLSPYEMVAPRVMRERRQLEDVEMGIKRPDGTLTWVNISAAPLINAADELEGVVCSFSDITVRRRAEEGLRISEAFHRALSDALPDVIFVLDAAGAILKVNRAFPGNSKEDYLGQRASIVFPPEYHDVFEEAFRRARDTGRLQTVETAAALSDGRHYFLNRLKPVRLPGEEGVVVLVSTDITVRKLTDERYRVLLEGSRDAIMTLTPPSWRFSSGNPAAVKMFGARDEDHFVSFGPRVLSPPLQPDGRPSGDKAREMIETAMREGSHLFEWTHKRVDGTSFPSTVLLSQVELAGQALLLATVRDVSNQKHLETELSHARKLEAVGQLAAGIAHEINTPVQFVGDSIHFLEEAFEDQRDLIVKYRQAVEALGREVGHDALLGEIKEAEEAADFEYLQEHVPGSFVRCLDGLSRISSIVGAMKEFAHPDQREKIPADLNQALQATLIIAKNEYKYVAELQTELGELPQVLCHVGDLNQVFLNLIVNAAHAIGDVVGETGAMGTIRARTAIDGDSVRIELGDTGCGIPEAVRDRVFDPFFTTKDVGRGSGQGLTIARSIVVDKHSGSLYFETEEGRGTTFIMRLPIDGKGGESGQARS